MLPRGIRNNNPLNIKIGNDWKGEVSNTDGTFEQFESMEYGLRAAFIILHKYLRKYGRNTLRKIIHSWSPDGEKAENAYMSCVSQWCGHGLDEIVRWEDRDLMCKIVQGMARVENGMTINMNYIYQGYDMANNDTL